MLSQFARSACRRAAAPARRAAAARAYAAEGGANGGSHSDFAPQSAAGEDADVQARIAEMVEGDDVVLFMKGTPNAPQCGFSNMACRVLELYDVKFTGHNVLADPLLREGIKKYSSWPTIPQLYVKGEFVGGSDIMLEMHKNEELDALFKK